MSTEVRQSIADSRAQYFSDFNHGDQGGGSGESGDTSEDDTGQRKPSYVGLSHAINGYTPYSQYNGRVKKISPPLQIPVSPPRTLDSVGLVLSQDSYYRSVTEFEQVMRDLSNGSLDMARPQRNADVIDAAGVSSKRHVISNGGDNFYPKTQNRQIIADGDKQSVEIVTKFHCDEDHSPTYRPSPNGSRQNLVQKQIERLYGDTGPYQVRMTSPEPVNGENGDPVNGHSPQNGDSEKAERKSSGGFFAKRFGLVKMKDHSSRKVVETRNSENSDNNQMDFKPLKVPAVFRLLRPEFREQLKQSSCKIDANVVTPTSEKGKDWTKERIIPIRREGGGACNIANGKTPTPERVVPINVSQNTNNDANGVLNNNNNNMKTPSSAERVIPIRRESGEINSTPKRPVGFAPKVNGFNTSNNMAGLRSNGSISSSSKPTASEDKPSDKVENGNNNSKQGIVRKLSPLSPKHIVVPNSAEKPAPMPKPDHLKSPPMSPEPVNGTGSPSPPLPRVDRSPSSPTPPSSSSTSSVPEPEPAEPKVGKPVEPLASAPPASPPTPDTLAATTPVSGRINGDNDTGVSPRPLLTPDTHIVSPEVINNNINNKPEPVLETYEDYDRNNGGDYDNPEEYPEEYYYDNPPPCGLRERELLCPIMEEDNESTASGSIMNLAERSNGAVIGNSGYSPDDPLLISEQGEIQDGHYFIKVLENEIFKFEENICDFEEDLNGGGNIPDDVRDTILTVIGMAKLLMAQKLTQFRELCYKNINVSREEDPFVPTCQDLAGFWDMVSIQVDQIHDRFQKLVDLRKAGWVVKKPEVVKNNKTAAVKKTPVNKSKPKEKSEAAKARDEARKKMMEDRKAKMKEMKEKAKKQAQGGDDVILIM